MAGWFQRRHRVPPGPAGFGINVFEEANDVLRLVLGLYPTEEGLILIDGTDLRQLDPADLRGSVGAAMQESVLLTGSSGSTSR